MLNSLAMPRVALFVSCLVDRLFPQIGLDTVSLLERAGVEVVVPESQTCCGQPAFNAGFPDEARPVVESALRCLADCDVDAIVVPSGSCAAMLSMFAKEITADRPHVHGKVFELSQFLVNVLGRTDVGARLAGRAVYHDSCHLMRALSETSAPRRLLREVRELELVELGEPTCCGFGGTFSMKMPEISDAMLRDKIDAIERSGAQTVISSDISCLMHIGMGLERRGSPIRTMHLAEVLSCQ